MTLIIKITFFIFCFSEDFPAISSLAEMITPLNDANIEVFADTVDSYMGRYVANQPSLLRLLRAFCVCLKSFAEEGPEAVARAWIAYGALQMQCAFPASPLDPSIVNAFKIAITRDEVRSCLMCYGYYISCPFFIGSLVYPLSGDIEGLFP